MANGVLPVVPHFGCVNSLTPYSSTVRALGSVNSRLSNCIDTLKPVVDDQDVVALSRWNTPAADGGINDVDLAFETVRFSKADILQSTGLAMLAQANQAPQQLLALFR